MSPKIIQLFMIAIMLFSSLPNAHANTKKTYVVITVDTETYGPPYTFESIDPVVDGVGYGISKIMDICDNSGVKATFFVDVYEYKMFGYEKMRNLVRKIHDRGHDVQYVQGL